MKSNGSVNLILLVVVRWQRINQFITTHNHDLIVPRALPDMDKRLLELRSRSV